ncbi:MAG: efflux RND transporter periplasmic adaptor subunit [Myxococcota bacterium]
MRAVGLLRQLLLSVAIIAVAVVVFVMFVKTKPTAQRAEVKQTKPMVQVQAAHKGSYTVYVKASGVAEPARTVVLTAQVGGRVIQRHSQLVPGGVLRAEQELVKVDPIDYELALPQSEAAVAQAQLLLQQEQARSEAAKQDFERLGDDEIVAKNARALALRIPHLRQAQANLRAANSALQRAKLQLQRTSVQSPFNAVVQSATVQVGAVISPQTPLATLMNTDLFWVKASVPVGMLPFLQIPVHGQKGSKACISSTTSPDPSTQKWQGHVVQLMSNLERLGNMAQLLIAVTDPLRLEQLGSKKRGVPLLVGTQVNLKLEGMTLKDVVTLPAQAVQSDNTVWVVASGNRLQRRRVQVVWQDAGSSVVQRGLSDNEQVVTSVIHAAKEGMVVQLQPPPTGQGKASSSGTNDKKTGTKSL